MNSVFRYPGGKSKVAKLILSYAPKHYTEARIPCLGGGGVFFNISTKKKRWINDINPYLMSVYFALRDRPKQFIESCRKIEPEKKSEPLAAAKKGKPLYNARLKAVFDNFVEDDSIDPALKYFFINRTVWAGRVNYDLPSRLYFSNPSGWNIIKKRNLENAAKALQNVKITCGSYEDLLQEPGKDVFIYLDPPYVVDTKLHKTSQLYSFNFHLRDHVSLCEHVKKTKHKICISYDDNDFIRALYREEDGFCINEEEWPYVGTSSGPGQSKTKRIGQELIITNYKVEKVCMPMINFGDYNAE